MTEAEYSNLEQSDPVDPRFEVDWSDTLLVGENPTLTNNLADFKIKEACIISSKIRKLIFDTLGYTCSSGIAHNKTLAKIVSSMNKPNKQTAIRQAAVLDFMASIKFSKIRGLGGKLGDTIESKLKVEKASDIWQYSLQELQAVLGIQAGTWLYDICRGECNEPVSPKEAKNSIQSFKNFRKKLTLISDIHEWALCFCHELFDRAQEEFEISKRWPKNISISIRCEQNKVSKSCPFPRRDLIKTAQDIYNVTEPLLAKEARIPLSGLGIALNNLEKPAASVAGYFKQIVNPTQSLVEESKPLSRINIDDYQRDIEDIIESEETYLCEICCKHIELSLRNEHNDFHFAETFNQHEPESGIPLLEEVDEMGQPTYYKCLECFKILPRTERQEHQDRHFAIEISRQLENPTASVTKRKREDQDKKIKEPGKKPQQKSIADFFTKKQPL